VGKRARYFPPAMTISNVLSDCVSAALLNQVGDDNESLCTLIKFDENEVLAYFRAEADGKIASVKFKTARVALTNTTTIDVSRALPTNSTTVSNQRERYKALLGMVK